LSNTFATAIDFTATRSSKALHRLLFCSIFFSVGTLMYSIPTTVYGSFRLKFSDKNVSFGWGHAAVLVAGTAVGMGLIVWLMRFEHAKTERANVDKNDPVEMMLVTE
jgi:hypothetical protein